MNSLSRTQKLIGETALNKLIASNILIVGVGGVGGYCLEMLVRSGISNITVVDGDCFDVTNINRQILSTAKNIGVSKVSAAKDRALQINPNCNIRVFPVRYNCQSFANILDTKYDYVIDCIDSVADKVHLIVTAKQMSLNIISAMGAGNRISPKFQVSDIFKTCNDGLARAVRTRIKGLVDSLKVVFDDGEVIKSDGVTASISYAPALMGCIMASEVIKDLCL